MKLASLTLSALVLLPVIALTACSSDEDENKGTPTTNGVNSVLKACEIRSSWKQGTTLRCTDCIAIASAPRCDCSDKDYAGSCNGQHTAKASEPTCEGVDACLFDCKSKPNDCGCVDACYTGKDACRTAAAALDGCTTELCASYCN